MSFDGTSGAGSSLQDLFGFLRGPAAAGPSPADPIAQALSDIARRARLPAVGGLFGGDYARFMADQPVVDPASAAPNGLNDFDPSEWRTRAVSGARRAGVPFADLGGPSAGSPASQDTGVGSSSAGQAVPSPIRQATPDILSTSPQGRAFIQRWELNSKTGQPYFDITPDDKRNPTFGYGHKVAADEQPALQAKLNGLTRAGQAALIDETFQKDLGLAEQRVKDRLGPEAVKTLTQNQFDALVADAFNAGTGGALGAQMQQNIWDGDMAAAGKQFNSVWATDAKTRQRTVMPGLVRRSLEQAAMFNRGDYRYSPTEAEKAEATRAAMARAAGNAR